MKKKLVSVDTIADFLEAGATEFRVDNNSMILTSGAKDYLRQKGIKLVYAKEASDQCPAQPVGLPRTENIKTLVAKIVSILSNDLQVRDAGTVERVTRRVLQGMNRR